MLFGGSGALRGGAVARPHAAQPVVLLDGAALGLRALGGEVVAGAAAVLAYEGRDEVDVVVGVADGCPAAARAVAGVDASGGDDAARDVGPLGVREGPVFGGGAYGGVPDVAGGAGVGGQEVQRLVEEAGEVGAGGVRVTAGVGGLVVEGGDEVRVGVLLAAARPVEVGEEAGRVAALLVEGRDHRAGPPASGPVMRAVSRLIPSAAWRTAVRVVSTPVG